MGQHPKPYSKKTKQTGWAWERSATENSMQWAIRQSCRECGEGPIRLGAGQERSRTSGNKNSFIFREGRIPPNPANLRKGKGGVGSGVEECLEMVKVRLALWLHLRDLCQFFTVDLWSLEGNKMTIFKFQLRRVVSLLLRSHYDNLQAIFNYSRRHFHGRELIFGTPIVNSRMVVPATVF